MILSRAGGYAYSPYGEQRNTVTAESGAGGNILRYTTGYLDRALALTPVGGHQPGS